MIRRRPLIFWLFLFGFAAALTVWSLYMPYRPQRLYRAIPAGASFVSSHHHLNDRWSDLTANPVVLALLNSLGADVKEVQDLGRDAEFRDWLARLAGDEIVASYHPRLGLTARPGWVFTSWLGGRCQRLRWMLASGRVQGFQKIYERAGRTVWMVRARWLKNRQVLSVCLTDGMLVACLSERGADMAASLDALDGLQTSYADWRGRAETFLHLRDAYPDRGWLAYEATPSHGLFIALNDVRVDRLEGWMDASWLSPEAMEQSDGLAGQELAALWRDRPMAALTADGAWARAMLESVTNRFWDNVLGLWRTNDFRGDLGLALLGGDFSGRWSGIRVPTVLAAFDLGASNTTSAAALCLDGINARTRWGLVPHVEEVPPYTVVAVEGTADNLYAALGRDEEFAFTSVGTWLLLGSNLHGMTNLLRDASSDPAPHLVPVDTQAVASGWMDLKEGSKALRTALVAYGLKLYFSDPEGSRAYRAQLNEYKTWIDAVAPLDKLSIAIRRGDRGPRLEFRAGPDLFKRAVTASP